jgi:spore coat protein U-like protein
LCRFFERASICAHGIRGTETPMKKIIAFGIALASLTGLSSRACAAPPDPATATFTVSITIVKECSVSTAPTSINFGTFGAVSLIATGATGTSNFSITCTSGTPYTVGFSSGNDLTAGSPTHQMKGTGSNINVVQYQLTDATVGATNTTPLSASTSVISDTGTGNAQNKTVQAQVINYTAAVAPDTYSDIVTLSVTY